MNITTIVPAFKVQFLDELLEGLMCQTLRPSQVLISDDTASGEFVQRLGRPEYRPTLDALNLSVLVGPKQGPRQNSLSLFRTVSGSADLIHLHLDDDIIYPTFYERHASVHTELSTICSVSKRWFASESGRPISSPSLPTAVSQSGVRLLSLSKSVIYLSTVVECNNWLGEFSNAVFKPAILPFIETLRIDEIPAFGLEDLAAFIWASGVAPVIYLNDFLGAFRVNPGQHSQDIYGRQMKLSHLSWIAIAIAGKRMGDLTEEQAEQTFRIIGGKILRTYTHELDLQYFTQTIPLLIAGDHAAEDQYLKHWEKYCIS